MTSGWNRNHSRPTVTGPARAVLSCGVGVMLAMLPHALAGAQTGPGGTPPDSGLPPIGVTEPSYDVTAPRDVDPAPTFNNTYRSLILDPALQPIRYFPLDETSGAIAFDRSPSGINASFVGSPVLARGGPLYGPSNGGNAALVNPISSGYISASVPTLTNAFNSALSIVLWFRAAGATPGTLIGTFDGPGTANGFRITLGRNASLAPSTTSIAFEIWNGQAQGLVFSANTPVFADSDWHMLTLVMDKGTPRVFYDDVEQSITTGVSTLRLPTTPPLAPLVRPIFIGATNTLAGSTDPLRADLAHVSFHTTAFTPAQVVNLWAAGNGYEARSLHNPDGIRGWFDAAKVQRVDAMFIGDSNVVISTDGGGYGHQYGMAQGLRRVLPIYAAAVLPGLGWGPWATTLNGLAPVASDIISVYSPLPGFIGTRVPPSASDFNTGVSYLPRGQTVPSDNYWRGEIVWDSSQTLVNFRRPLDLHLTYAQFRDGAGGVMVPGFRQFNAPYAAVGAKSILSAGTSDQIVYDKVPLPVTELSPNARYTLQINDYVHGLPAVGPFALLYTRFVDPSVTVGASITPAWAAGGKSARWAAFRFTVGCTTSQLGGLLRESVRMQPAGREQLLFQIIEGGNDFGDSLPAYNPDGSLSGFNSNTLSGQKTNTLTIMTRVREAWLGEGFPASGLHFLLGPYHPTAVVGPRIRYTFLRGWKELARDLPSWNISVLDAYGFTSLQEFLAGYYYQGGNQDQAHLTRAGYLDFGSKTWRTLASNFGVLTGACCFAECCTSKTCDLYSQASCAQAGGRYAGDSTTCPSPNGPAPACCKGDFNRDTRIDSLDLFAFLNAWFTKAPSADINADARVTIDDLFAFLAEWLTGC